jgi:magnesium-transporting ATPase (P-type)
MTGSTRSTSFCLTAMVRFSRSLLTKSEKSINFAGVLWLHDELYEKSNEVINKFVELGKKVYLITNNSQTTQSEMAAKCKKLGFDLEPVSKKKTHRAIRYNDSVLGEYDSDFTRNGSVPEIHRFR